MASRLVRDLRRRPPASSILAMPDLSKNLRQAVSKESAALQEGDTGDAYRWSTAKRAICKELGVAL